MANTIGVSQASGFIPEVWAQTGLGYLSGELYLARNVARDYDFEAAGKGSKVTIGKRGALQANAKAGNTAVTLQNPSSTPVEIDLDEHWEVTFIVEDIIKAQSNAKLMEGYMEDAVAVLAEKIETKLAALHTNFANASGADIVAKLKNARATLSTNKAPKTNRFAYLEPELINELLDVDGFMDASKYGSSMPAQEGEFGKFLGFRIFESVYTDVTGSSPLVTHNLAMHKNALVLATRPMPVLTPAEQAKIGVDQTVVERDGIVMRVTHSYDTDYLGHKITLDTLFGVGELRTTFGVDIES